MALWQWQPIGSVNQSLKFLWQWHKEIKRKFAHKTSPSNLSDYGQLE